MKKPLLLIAAGIIVSVIGVSLFLGNFMSGIGCIPFDNTCPPIKKSASEIQKGIDAAHKRENFFAILAAGVGPGLFILGVIDAIKIAKAKKA